MSKLNYNYDEAIVFLRSKGYTRRKARTMVSEARKGGPTQPSDLEAAWIAVYNPDDQSYWFTENGKVGDQDAPFCHEVCGDGCAEGCEHEHSPELVDRMFSLYSKYGESHDFTTVCSLLGIDRNEGLRLKRLHGLRKDSLPFGPTELHRMTDEDVLDGISDARQGRIRRKINAHHIRKLELTAFNDERLAAFIDARLQNIKPLEPVSILPPMVPFYPTAFVATHDLHFGKRDNRDATGWYQKIHAVKEGIEGSLKARAVKEIVVTFGSDSFNADTFGGTTTKGTQQDQHVTAGEMADLYISWFMDLVERLAKIAPVKVQVVQGNHDRMLSIACGMMLRHVFQRMIGVEVDCSEDVRKYHACGSTLVLTQHGDIKVRDLASVAYSEGARIFQRPFERVVVMQGHLHGFSLSTTGSVQHTVAPSAGPRGKWEADHFGDVDDMRMAVYYVPDDDWISAIDFVRG